MKTLLLGFALLVPFQLIAAEDDSVYSWGIWSQGIKPAAGPAMNITPAPVDQPRVNFRPNENSAFARGIQPAPPAIVPPAILPDVTPDSVQLPQVQVPIDNANTNPRTGRG